MEDIPAVCIYATLSDSISYFFWGGVNIMTIKPVFTILLFSGVFCGDVPSEKVVLPNWPLNNFKEILMMTLVL